MHSPATEAEARGLHALGQALDELQQAQVAGDQSTVWRLTLEVLNLMHSLDDQASKRLGHDYREVTRRASEDGRTQAALTLVRGIAHHNGSEVQAIAWRPRQLHIKQDGRWVPKQLYVKRDDEWVPTHFGALVAAWRPLSELPASTEKAHDRDGYYAQHVEGRGLMEPLAAAQRFLAGLHE